VGHWRRIKPGSQRHDAGAVLFVGTRISSGGRNQATRTWSVGRSASSAAASFVTASTLSGLIVELQKLCCMKNGFALVVTHRNSPSLLGIRQAEAIVKALERAEYQIKPRTGIAARRSASTRRTHRNRGQRLAH
jgi:hypothetical protein